MNLIYEQGRLLQITDINIRIYAVKYIAAHDQFPNSLDVLGETGMPNDMFLSLFCGDSFVKLCLGS
jgi:hypothetical protein